MVLRQLSLFGSVSIHFRFLDVLYNHTRESFLNFPATRFSLPYLVAFEDLCSQVLPSFLNTDKMILSGFCCTSTCWVSGLLSDGWLVELGVFE